MTEEHSDSRGDELEERSSSVGEDDAALEREIRSKRKFSVAEAIGRQAGDLLKGASPVTLKRQAELEIEHYLERELEDPEGALQIVLLRRVKESESLLEGGYEQPLEALAGLTGALLESEAGLRRFVTAIDAEWGRMYGERPYFEREGGPTHRKDPYSFESVRLTLTRLRAELAGGGVAE
jgi:hypothetical protein